MVKEKVSLPVSATELVLARKRHNMRNTSILIDGNSNIIPRSDTSDILGDTYTVIVKRHDKYDNLSSTAKSLKECGGKKGCEFTECAKNVFGKLPPNLQKACPIV